MDAYRAVVDRYDLRVIDLDIEGAALTDQAASERRAKAIAALQACTTQLRTKLLVPSLPDLPEPTKPKETRRAAPRAA